MIIEAVLNFISNIFSVLLIINIIDGLEISPVRYEKLAVIAAVPFSLFMVSNQFMEQYTLNLILHITMIVVPCIIAFQKIKLSYLYIFIITDSLISILSSNIMTIITNLFTVAPTLCKSSVQLLLRITLYILLFISNKKNILSEIQQILKIIPTKINIAIILTLAFNAALCTTTIFLEKINSRIIIFHNLSLLLLTFFISSVIFSLLINVVGKKHYTDTAALLEKQIRLQLDHYSKLDKLNDEMRRFRHDYINHLNSVSALINSGEYTEAQDYITTLTDEKPSSVIRFLTGNILADAILTEKADISPEKITIEFNGIIPTDIDNIDLCTILSNAMDNAVEACMKCSGKCVIKIAAQIKQGYFVMTVVNPSDSEKIYDHIPATSKADKINHGFGLLSIKQAVKKYDGDMMISSDGKSFELTVVMKI